MIKLVNSFLTEHDKEKVNNFLEDYNNMDPIRELKNKIKQIFQINNCYPVNSGSSALHIALMAIGVKKNDEVICTTHTCVAILNAIKYVGANVILVDCKYDVNKMDYNIKLNDIKKKITSKTKALIIPHMFGVACEIEEIKNIGIPIIEDITLSVGARFSDSSLIGTKGDITVSSFHRTKVISADVGGIIWSNNQKYEKNICDILDYDGMYSLQYKQTYNYVMGDINAVLAASQIDQLEKFISIRRKNADILNMELRDIKYINIPDINKNNIYFRYIIEINNEMTSEYIVNEGIKKGIQFGRGVFPALHNVLGLDNSNFVNSERAQKKLLSIPVYPGLSKSDLIYICDTLKNILRS
ncbi:DegT/DnrJ/EryC1/StrS family aminotransferase [Clostridium sp. Sa3CUN1]|uniref:DegT/DnrJ/EryC1/StrS family aminotransferase n=1 Tax=Clostridium gallinarum TaxID=2762246 RepID=A0ABR8Q5E0_9CLOT|nr:DegT/DnrJ/EryC1/StrS family aminotransferase [Clostridium gallinarum]MBD7915650.1 DegT/DnrJ/EryC1/StrS family aminotransferase [Clostridium gallinarum]